jgi:hypothetical protein
MLILVYLTTLLELLGLFSVESLNDGIKIVKNMKGGCRDLFSLHHPRPLLGELTETTKKEG